MRERERDRRGRACTTPTYRTLFVIVGCRWGFFASVRVVVAAAVALLLPFAIIRLRRWQRRHVMRVTISFCVVFVAVSSALSLVVHCTQRCPTFDARAALTWAALV